ncbi:MAG: excinuclease ABC subunit UvrC [Chitinispirillaceae bacterium]|nr:excinuclease ABC subunit UvrC [Chitinispirillaceae bacterium]
MVRRVEKDGSRYFGPFTDVRSMRSLVGFAKRIFKLCDCSASHRPVAKRNRPCINYEMKRCSGACAGMITAEAYRAQIDNLLLFLSGKRNSLLHDLETRMHQESEQLHFEEAAFLRDQISLIRDAGRLQHVDLKLPDVNCDVFGVCEGDRHVCMVVLQFREGLLLSTVPYIFSRALWTMPETTHDSVVLQFYLQGNRLPPEEIFLSDNSGFDADTLTRLINERFGAGHSIRHPQKGSKLSLVDMAEKNAKLHLIQKIPPSGIEDCADLQKVLNLETIPAIIEAFDISNLGESFCVAGMVRFKNGAPDKSGYRRFKIKTVEGQNDFAMLLEAVSRRLTRLQNENSPFPDLILIDGGLGQLHAAMQALSRFENPPAIVSLAKQEELIFSPLMEQPVRLDANHPARRLVERIRDEVHRYAITYHRKMRGKQFSRSKLEDLPGIGPMTAKILLKKFGSMKRLVDAAPEQIAETRGFSLDKAVRLKEALITS